MKTADAICFLCERTFASLEAAERCEQRHHERHDAHCGCEDCCVSRAYENREEPNR